MDKLNKYTNTKEISKHKHKHKHKHKQQLLSNPMTNKGDAMLDVGKEF